MADTSTNDNMTDEKQRNRQINFLIMRRMWQEVRGRASSKKSAKYEYSTIYEALNTTRERYTRVIETGVIRIKKNELDEWSRITGVDKKIFTGEEVFQFVYIDGIREEHIVAKEKWDEYFDLRSECKSDKDRDQGEKETEEEKSKRKERMEQLKKVEKEIFDYLRNALDHVSVNKEKCSSFYAFYYYLKKGEATPLLGSDAEVQKILPHLRKIRFDVLNTCSESNLKKMYEALKQGYDMARKVYEYKGLAKLTET